MFRCIESLKDLEVVIPQLWLESAAVVRVERAPARDGVALARQVGHLCGRDYLPHHAFLIWLQNMF